MGGSNNLSWVMIAVAVIPPLLLMIFINKKDKHDKEPLGLLFKCAFFGALSVIFSLIGEEITMRVIPDVMHSTSSIAYYAVLAFLGVAVVEETGKYLALRLATWRDPNFNYTFDGIVYSVYASLGFALVENIVYVIRFGGATGLLRAVTAIPGHASFGVYMGFFYGNAKFYEVAGNRSKKSFNLWMGWLTAVILHGFYDFFAMSHTDASAIFFFAFIIGLDVIVIVQVFRSAKNDTPIYQTYRAPMYQMQFRQVYQNPYYAQQMQGAYRAPVYLQQQYGGPAPGYGAQNPYAAAGQSTVANPYVQNGQGYGANPNAQGGQGYRANAYAQNGQGYGANPYAQNGQGYGANPYAQNGQNYGAGPYGQAAQNVPMDPEGETGHLRR